MAKKKESDAATNELKEILSAEVGGNASDWKRVSKKKYYGDIARDFENKTTGEKISTYVRDDGLVYAETAEGREITARLPFNKAAKPAAADVIMNKILEDKEVDTDGALYKKAAAEGLVKRFSFYITKNDDGSEDEGPADVFAVIYPTVRDDTFKCASAIAPLVPKGDDTDECMVTEWRFKGLDTPGKVAKHLVSLGMTWDTDLQKRWGNVAEIREELGLSKPATAAKGPKR